MAIPADGARIVRDLILMTGDTNFSSGRFPFVWNMATGTFRARVSRLKMQLASARMAGNARGDRFNALFLLMALGASEGHGSVRRAPMTRGALHHHSPSPPMTVIAAELDVLLLKRPRVLEFFCRLDVGRLWNLGLLGDDGVAELAVFADHLPVPTHMFPFMTAKTAGVQGMPDVVRVGTPIHLHLGKDIGLIDPLNLRDGLFDHFPLFCVKPRITSEIKAVQ